MFLSISDFWIDIAQALEDFGQQIGGWNWENIIQYAKNLIAAVSWPTVIYFLLRYVIPILKGSNKPVLKEVGAQAEIIKLLADKLNDLERKEQTVGQLLEEWIVLQSDVNSMSRTLSPKHKQAFIDLAEKMKEHQDERIRTMGIQIDEIVDDGEVSADEVKDLIENTKTGEQVFGTNLNDIVGEDDEQQS
jgi:hypothetical protein